MSEMTTKYIAECEKLLHESRHWKENPHFEMPDEECTSKLTPDEIEQQMITEQEHGK